MEENELLALYIGYMDKVFANARVDYLRKLKRINDHEVLPGELPEGISESEVRQEGLVRLDQVASDQALQAALRWLSGNEATVLFQLICMERTVQDVADALGITPNSVYRIKGRALRKLRDILTGGMIHG